MTSARCASRSAPSCASRSSRACVRSTRAASTRATSTRVMAEHDLLGLSVPKRVRRPLRERRVVVRLRRGAGQGLGHGLADGRLREARVAADDCWPAARSRSERVLPGAALRRAARLVRALGAQRGLGPGRAGDARGAPRRHVGAQRREALHRQRGAQRRLRGLRAHGRRGRQGRQRLPRRRARRRRLLAEAAHDGHAGLAARRAALRGRRGAGGEPARPRGRRLPDRDGDLRPLAPDGRRAGGRPRRRARSTSRSTTRRAATRSASRCSPTRACSSSSPTWRPRSPRRGR